MTQSERPSNNLHIVIKVALFFILRESDISAIWMIDMARELDPSNSHVIHTMWLRQLYNTPDDAILESIAMARQLARENVTDFMQALKLGANLY